MTTARSLTYYLSFREDLIIRGAALKGGCPDNTGPDFANL
jgi:hypothetical protein